MSGILIAAILVLNISCLVGQNFFNRLFSGSYPGSSGEATPVFSVIYGSIVGVITLAINGFRFAPSGVTWLMGAVNGLTLFLYNLGMIESARRGPFSFQNIVKLFGGIVCSLVFSALWWGDDMSPLRLVGIVIMLASFVVMNSGGLKFSDIRKGYFLWVISLFFTNGLYGILLDAQQRVVANEHNEMIMVTYVFTALISLAYLLILRRGEALKAFRMGGKAATHAVLSSTCSAFGVIMTMFLLGHIHSYILYAVQCGSVLAVCTVLCAVVLKERITKVMSVGILMSLVSIAMLTL